MRRDIYEKKIQAVTEKKREKGDKGKMNGKVNRDAGRFLCLMAYQPSWVI